MNNSPKISVLLASYKHSRWIGEAIESVLYQSYKNLELIIVDDGSNDGSAEVIERYAANDDRIKYEIFLNNQGPIFAIQRCYELSSGDFIATISSDDVWKIDKLELQVPMLVSDSKLGAIFGLPDFIDENSQPITTALNVFSDSLKFTKKEQWLNYFFKKGNCICHPTILIRRECYEKVGFYNIAFRSLPDFEFWVRLFSQYDVKVINKKLINFRKHTFNESGPNLANIIRCQTEYKQILCLFPKLIKTMDELISTFPEHLSEFKIKHDLLVPFYLGVIAKARNERFSTDFALDIFYQAFATPDVCKLIVQNNLYSPRQLAQDVVNTNIYCIPPAPQQDAHALSVKVLFKKSIIKVLGQKNTKRVKRVLGLS